MNAFINSVSDIDIAPFSLSVRTKIGTREKLGTKREAHEQCAAIPCVMAAFILDVNGECVVESAAKCFLSQ